MAQTLAVAAAARDWAFECVGRPQADLMDPDSVDAVIQSAGADIVINAAAYTAVDQAESEEDLARAINVDGAASLARACAEARCGFIHMSTDCVFDGGLDRAYQPDDSTGPLGAYGRSKLDGELAVTLAYPQSLIVRVSWIFSEYGNSFVRTMLRLARDRDELTIVDDQVGFPTFAPDLANGLLNMAAKSLAPGFQQFGTYHLCGRMEANRAEWRRRFSGSAQNLAGPLRRSSVFERPIIRRRPAGR